MANKIVQLQNKDGDNIFPVSAGLASDSVTTDMIQDGAVTSDKVDFTTFDQDITTGAIANNAVTTAKIANTAVTAGKINFSSFANNQSNIRKIYVTTFTATTDGNGFMAIPTGTVTPSTGVPLYGKINTAGQDGFLFFFCANTESRWTIRIAAWDYSSVANKTLSVTIYYLLS